MAMNINFGSQHSNCNIIFDINGNYKILGNDGYPAIRIRGANYNARMVNAFNGYCAANYNANYSPSFSISSPYGVFNGLLTLPSNFNMVKPCEIFIDNAPNYNKPFIIPSNTNVISNYLIRYCNRFSQPITIPNGVTSVDKLMIFCSGFNAPINIPNSINSKLTNFLYSCASFNQPIKIPSNVVNIHALLSNCYYYNQNNFKIPNNVVDISDAFSGFAYGTTFSDLVIPNSVTHIGNLFYNVKVNLEFYAPNLRLPPNATNATYLFAESNAFPTNVPKLPNSVTNVDGLFSYSRCGFNDPLYFQNLNISSFQSVFSSTPYNVNVLIPDSVQNLYGAFRGSGAINCNIKIPNNAINISDMFSNCRNLNQPIYIPDGVTILDRAFFNCRNLNANIRLPYEMPYLNLTAVFQNCYNLNQNIQLPRNTNSFYSLFENCYNLNQNIFIPRGRMTESDDPNYVYCVCNYSRMFANCNNLSDITIYDQRVYKYPARWQDFVRVNNAQRLNIHTGNNTVLNLINLPIVNTTPTWDVIENGYKNDLYNIYIYTNTVFPE